MRLDTDTHNFVPMFYDDAFFHGGATPVAVTETGGVPLDVADIDFRVIRGHEIHGSVPSLVEEENVRRPV